MHDCLNWSATEIARRIAAREISAREVCAAYIERCELTHKFLNALVWNRFDGALQDAAVLDEKIARGEHIGPLAGVPITVKDCFFAEGSPACIGLSHLKGEIAEETGSLVQRLQRAGAVLLGKTNVPQLMLWHECDNPVYGRTNNPWNLERTPGGSSGGEAAIIAAHGSALGLGNDLGGSIRVPAAWCGIQGLKPTSRRLPNSGARQNFRGLQAMVNCAGPLARHVEDLDLALNVLADYRDGEGLREVEPWPLRNFREVDVSQLRIGICLDDGAITPSVAIQRGVREAGATLASMGATVIDFQGATSPLHDVSPGEIALILYSGLISADGGADLRRIAEGSRLDWRAGRILMLLGMGKLSRRLATTALRLFGQHWLANMLSAGGASSADSEWRTVRQQQTLERKTEALLNQDNLDAVICPAHALPAPQHGKPIDLLAAASFAFLPNLLGWPAGVVSNSTVHDDEQVSRPPSRDLVLKQAAAVDAGSAGLPVGVQVIARPWREDIVLAVMAAIERALPRLQLPNSQLAAIGVKN